MNADLSRVVEEFATTPMAAGKVMREMLGQSDPRLFLEAVIPLLRSSLDKPGTQYLLTLLLINDLILTPLIDPAVFSFEQAIAIARHLVKIEPLLDIKMMRRVVDSSINQDELYKRVDTSRGIRLLEVMAAVSDGARILPVMSQLLRHTNPRIRSKAALLVGRSNKNCKWVEQRLGEPDARVRANAVESLWGLNSQDAKNVFWAAVNDHDNRVAGNALAGLYGLGDNRSIPYIVEMASDARTDFRGSGVWVMGETGDPRFLSVLARMISDPDAQVRAAVFHSIARLKQAAAKSSLRPNLMMHLTPLTSVSGAGREISAAIWEQTFDGVQPVSGLRPTQFVLYEDSRLVTQYEMRENFRSESLSVAFALPRITERNHPFHVQSESAFQAAFPHKRKSDAWLILKYLSDAERVTSSSAHGGKRIFQIEEWEPATADNIVPADVQFESDPEAILDALQSPGNRMLLPHGPIRAILSLLAPLSHCRGSRHVVLLYQPETPETDWGLWQEVARAALPARVNVHVIASRRQPELVELTAKTGGTFTLIAGPGQFQMALEGLCASLIHSYSIRYYPIGPDELAAVSSLKVRVYRPGGFGEAVLDPGGQVLQRCEVA